MRFELNNGGMRLWIMLLVLTSTQNPPLITAHGSTVLLEMIITNTTRKDEPVIRPKKINEYRRSFYEIEFDFYWTDKNGNRINDGPEYLLFKTFEEKTGIRLHKVIPTPLSFGDINNDTYDGEVGLLQENLADVTSNPMLYTSSIFRYVDFTIPVQSSPWCLAIRKAPATNFGKVLVLPFHKKVWMTILVTYITTTAVMHFFKRNYSKKQSFQRTILNTVQIFFSGGCSSKYIYSEERIVLGSLLLVTLILSNAYQGQLLGFLTSPPNPAQIQTLQDAGEVLNEIYSYESFTETYTEEKDDPLLHIRKKIAMIDFEDTRKMMKIVSSSYKKGIFMELGLHSAYSLYPELTDHGKELFHIVPEYVYSPGHLGHVVRKNSSLYCHFAPFVMHVVENGLFNHWNEAQEHRMVSNGVFMPKMDEPTAQEPRPLQRKQLSGAFVLLLVGQALATVIFSTEHSLARCNRRFQTSVLVFK